MDTSNNTYANFKSWWSSIGSVIREILRESRNRRIVIKKSSDQKTIELSVLLALILSIGAPVLPILVILGVLVESISVSFEKRRT